MTHNTLRLNPARGYAISLAVGGGHTARVRSFPWQPFMPWTTQAKPGPQHGWSRMLAAHHI